MSTGFPFFLPAVHEGLHALRRNWGWLLTLGILEILAGIVAIAYPVQSTDVAMQVAGILLFIGAGVQFASAIWALRWGGFFLHLIIGLLYLFVGEVLFEHPFEGALIATWVLAVFLVAGGVIRIVGALSQRFAAWGWTLLSGIISLLLGIMIWRQWPVSGLWVIGTFVGIELIFSGWTWVMLAMAVRSIPEQMPPPNAPV
jgi:uncharacterized membrane protein HdeD (DUF308 family)